MPKTQSLGVWSPSDGYRPSDRVTGQITATIYRGQNLWVRPGGITETYLGVGTAVAGSGGTLGAKIFPLDQYRGELSGALISGRHPRSGLVRYRNAALFFLSEQVSTQVLINESTTSPFTLTGVTTSANTRDAGQLRVALPDSAGTTYTAYDAGLDAPTATLAVAQSTDGAKSMTGSYSLRILRKRTATQTVSNPGPFNVQALSGSNDAFLVTLPSLVSGQDAWIIAGTYSGSGVSGPWWEVREVQNTINGTWDSNGAGTITANASSNDNDAIKDLRVFDAVTINATNCVVATITDRRTFTVSGGTPASGTGLSVTIRDAFVEWANRELVNLIAFDNDRPPKAAGCFTFNDILFLWGTYGLNDTIPGPGISPAKPNNPEAFPVLATVYTAGAEDIIQVWPAEGKLYVGTVNTLQVSSYTSAESPFLLRPIWNFGFATAYSGVIADQTFYGFCGRGPARTRADESPDFAFAADVKSDMASWTASNVVLGYDPMNQAVCYFHYDGSTNTTCLPFMLQTQNWSTPIIIPGRVTATATVNGQLELIVDIGSDTYRKRTFEATSGTVTGDVYAAMPYSDAQAEGLDKIIRRVNITARASSARIYINNADLTSTDPNVVAAGPFTLSDTAVIPQEAIKTNVKAAKVFSVRVDLSGASRAIHEISTYGVVSGITR